MGNKNCTQIMSIPSDLNCFFFVCLAPPLSPCFIHNNCIKFANSILKMKFQMKSPNIFADCTKFCV